MNVLNYALVFIAGFTTSLSIASFFLVVRIGKILEKRDQTLEDKDRQISAFSMALTPALKDLVELMKRLEDRTEKGDKELSEAMTKFGNWLGRMVVLLQAISPNKESHE